MVWSRARCCAPIYIRHRASVHEVGVWCSLQGRLAGTPLPEPVLEKWQSHCSEKVNEIDFSQGAPKSRNAKFAPRCRENAGFAENARFLLPGEPVCGTRSRSPGDPENRRNFNIFSMTFRMGFGRPLEHQNVPKDG